MNEQQKQLAGNIVALGATITEAMDDCPGFVPCGTPAQITLDAIATLNADDDAEIARETQTVAGFVQHVAGHRGVRAHEPADVSNLSATQQQLVQKIAEFATGSNGSEVTPEQSSWLYRSLAAFEHDDAAAEAQLRALG